MRKEFINQLLIKAKENSSLWLLTADLGFSFLERFEQEFPQRYINVGVAEQNLISVGAGLAMTGKKVFLYSIINFLTFRALEQIRQDVCYHDLDVHLVGVGAGFSYKGAGYSHYAIEDIAIMKSLPHLRIYSPADAFQTSLVMEEISRINRPTYIRLGKNQERSILPVLGSIDQGFVYSLGKDILCIALGDLLYDLHDQLGDFFEKKGIFPTLFSVVALKPFKGELLESFAAQAKKIIVFEHHKTSGLTSIIYQMKIKCGFAAKIDTYALNDDATEPSTLPSLQVFLEANF